MSKIYSKVGKIEGENLTCFLKSFAVTVRKIKGVPIHKMELEWRNISTRHLACNFNDK